jgi:hypothetical protein
MLVSRVNLGLEAVSCFPCIGTMFSASITLATLQEAFNTWVTSQVFRLVIAKG